MKLRLIISTVLTVMAAAAMAAPATTSLKAAIDSAAIEQGDRTVIHLQLIKDRTSRGDVMLPQENKEFHGVEVVETTSDTGVVDDRRMQINYNILIQAFDPGLVTIPPFAFADGADTTFSDILTLKVLPVDLDTLTTINPMEGVVTVKSRWYDVIPDWWYWVVIAIAVLALGAGIYMLYRKNGKTLLPAKKQLPPYEVAISRLNDLKQRRLAENGHEKEYYTELTDILRQYLEKRFGIFAMEMTSSQILDALRHHDETRMSSALMKQVLEIADFVKFAKVRPLPDDNVKSFNSAMQFVEDTKPAPEPEAQPAASDNTKTKNK